MKKLNKFWFAVEDWISGILLLVGLSLIFYGVVMRYLFNNPITWVDEISKYLVIWGCLIGAAVALRDDHHIKVDLLYNFLPGKVKRVVSVFANLVGLAFAIFITYYGTVLMQIKLQIGQRSMDVGVPLWMVYLIFPVAGLMLIIRFVEQLYMIYTGEHRQGGVTY